MGKIIRNSIIAVMLIALLALCGYALPRVMLLVNLSQTAKSKVSQSSADTFMETRTTIVYDANGAELCLLKDNKDLYYVGIDEIPKTLQSAFVVMEDNDFFKHSGIDIKSIIRAAFVNQQQKEIVQGASTITQQLAKNIFLTQDVTWERKLEEMFVAFELEKKYSKSQLLEFYLNNIYFSNGYYGVQAAAKGYFNKNVSELTVSEQAFIAAIPNGPTRYNPYSNYENTIKRRNVILRRMYDAEYISSIDFYIAYNEEVNVVEKSVHNISDSVLTYVRHSAAEAFMKLNGFVFRYDFTDASDYERYQESYDIFYSRAEQMMIGGGYTIYTSIVPNIQDMLQAAIDEQLKDDVEMSEEGIYKLQGAATVIDNITGNVVAIVGGRNQGLTGLTLNRAYQSPRQSGSSIKPLIAYLPYFMMGHNGDEIVVDEYFDGGPRNADRYYAGEMTISEAIKKSKNTIAWKVYEKVTPASGIGYLMRLGFKSVWPDKEYMAACLGGFTYGVTTEEMAGGFATIYNNGVYRKPTCIIQIYNSQGKLVIDEAGRGTTVYTKEACLEMTQILETVMEPGGTGVSADVSGWDIAGKTGSTTDNKDLWFCGYSPLYTTAIWVGYDYPKVLRNGSRANYIFRDFMTLLHQDKANVGFVEPERNNDIALEQQSEETTEEATAVVNESINASAVAGATEVITRNPELDIDVDVSGLQDIDVSDGIDKYLDKDAAVNDETQSELDNGSR